MKISNIHFLAKSNIKGNKNSGTITLLICLLTVAVTIVSCFSVTTVNAVNIYKEDYKARSLWIDGCIKALTPEAIEAIEAVEHVETVADVTGLPWYWGFRITETDDAQLAEGIKNKDTDIYICSLYEGEEKSVIKGKTLDESPMFSCLVPSIFYPFSNIPSENIDYIDGTTLIGKTITIKGLNDKIYINYNTLGYEGKTNQSERYLNSPEFTLKIVGTYPCSYAASGNFFSIYISRETNLNMTRMTLEEAGIDLSTNEEALAQWWNTPSSHNYLVVVDEYDNIGSVFNVVRKDMGYAISSSSELPPDDVTMLMATVFSTVGTFLTAAIAFIAVFLLVQSSVNSIRARKGFIGLMKAIGYKNHQIFTSLIYEQLYMSLRAFLIGGVISTLIVFFANLKFEHGTFRQTQYIIDWRIFGVFLIISFLIALFVPLITQLLLLMKLTKIEPREAMNG